MMKRITLVSLFGLLSLAHVHAQKEEPDVRSVGLLPQQRQGIVVQPGEQNPYGFPTQKKKASTSMKREYSQEDQIRDILQGLEVTGVIGNGRIVLLEDLVLEAGEFVDDVLPGQNERLLVKEITSTEVLIEWVEEFKRKKPRQMKIPIDMQTRVVSMLKGQSKKPQKRMGYARLSGDEEERKQ